MLWTRLFHSQAIQGDICRSLVLKNVDPYVSHEASGWKGLHTITGTFRKINFKAVFLKHLFRIFLPFFHDQEERWDLRKGVGGGGVSHLTPYVRPCPYLREVGSNWAEARQAEYQSPWKIEKSINSFWKKRKKEKWKIDFGC